MKSVRGCSRKIFSGPHSGCKKRRGTFIINTQGGDPGPQVTGDDG